MNRIYLLDTNTVSYIARDQSRAARNRLRSLSHDEIVCISSITEAEIRYGIAKNPLATRRIIAAELLIEQFQVLPWRSQEAQTYGKLRAQQEALGKTIENLDLLIAAHAITTQSTLVTRDKVFHHIPDVRAIENWATDL